MTFYITAVLAWPAAIIVGFPVFKGAPHDDDLGTVLGAVGVMLAAAIALALLPFLLTGRLA